MRAELVGRSDELAMLTDCVDASAAWRAALVICRGEPGIGKTRLAEELAARAAARGVVTAWGRADDSPGAPPFWPWRQVLRGIGEQIDLESLARECRLADDLGRL